MFLILRTQFAYHQWGFKRQSSKLIKFLFKSDLIGFYLNFRIIIFLTWFVTNQQCSSLRNSPNKSWRDQTQDECLQCSSMFGTMSLQCIQLTYKIIPQPQIITQYLWVFFGIHLLPSPDYSDFLRWQVIINLLTKAPSLKGIKWESLRWGMFLFSKWWQ